MVIAGTILGNVRVGPEEIDIEFDKFLIEHGKIYADVKEKQSRKEYFRDTYKFIKQYNDMSEDLKLEINDFADMSPEEITMRKSLKTSTSDCTTITLSNPVNPRIDWRARNAVTRVKDQGACGSCWAFSTVGALEGLYAIQNGNLAEFSEQYLLNCAGQDYGNLGCDGGWMPNAFSFVKDHGIALSSDVPYLKSQQTCQLVNPIFSISGCAYVEQNNNEQLLQAVNLGPVSVAIKSSSPVFMYYKSGIITSNCGQSNDSVDHAVLIVGAGIQNGIPYWIVKNSWGTKWGQNGYAYIKRDSGINSGVCGIASAPSYPLP
jgi:C1A family cysteine protease